MRKAIPAGRKVKEYVRMVTEAGLPVYLRRTTTHLPPAAYADPGEDVKSKYATQPVAVHNQWHQHDTGHKASEVYNLASSFQ